MTRPESTDSIALGAPDLTSAQNRNVPFTPVDVPVRRNGAPGPDRVSLKKERAIASLLEGRSITEVAADVGVHRATVHRWLNDPAFERELSDRREAFMDSTFDFLAYGGRLATLKLMELLESEDEKVALRAAQALVRASVSVDHERRIRRMEDNLGLSDSGV